MDKTAYENVRKTKLRDRFTLKAKKSLKEFDEFLDSDSESEDEELIIINGFDPKMPISLQAFQHTTGKFSIILKVSK